MLNENSRLFSCKGETLESYYCKLAVLLLEPVGNRNLVTITKLELLVNETVLFQELGNTTLSDVLYHLCWKICSLLSSCLLTYLFCLVSILTCEPSLVDVRLNVVVRVNEVWIDASFLDGVDNSLLYLLLLCLLNSYIPRQ